MNQTSNNPHSGSSSRNGSLESDHQGRIPLTQIQEKVKKYEEIIEQRIMPELHRHEHELQQKHNKMMQYKALRENLDRLSSKRSQIGGKSSVSDVKVLVPIGTDILATALLNVDTGPNKNNTHTPTVNVDIGLGVSPQLTFEEADAVARKMEEYLMMDVERIAAIVKGISEQKRMMEMTISALLNASM